MGFLDTLRRVLSGHRDADTLPIDRRLGDSSGFGEVGSGADDDTDRPVEGPSAFDRQQWEKKLKHILGALPEARGQWGDLLIEARALGFDPGWVAQRQREEFALLVRGAVADRRVTEPELRKLELARELIGLPVAQAEAILHDIAAEAESFFGQPVEEGGSGDRPQPLR